MLTRRAPRWPVLATGLALAAVAAGASAWAGNYGQAVFNFGLLAGIGIFLAFSRTELALAQSDAADERQRSLNTQAIQYAYVAVAAVALVGFFWELAAGSGVGPFTLICFVGGTTHIAGLVVLSRRS